MRLWSRLVPMLRPHRAVLMLTLLQILGSSAIELLKPWPLKLVVDTVIGGHPAPGLVVAALPAGLLAFRPLLVLATTAIVAIALGSGALRVWHNHTAIGLGQRLVAELRGRLHAHLLRLSLAFHAERQAADLTYRITADSFAVQTWIMNGLLPMVSAAILLAGMVAVLLPLDPWLTLTSLTIVPVLFLTIGRFNRRISAVATILRDRQSGLQGLVQTAFGGIRVVQAFGQEAREHQRFVEANAGALDTGLRLYDWQALYGAVVDVIVAAGTALVLYQGTDAVLAGRISLGGLVIFVSYLAMLYGPVNQIAQSWGLIAGARIGLVRCFEILDRPADLVSGPETLAPERAEGTLRWEDISFAYRPGRLVLDRIDLAVEPGERVAIVGRTGAGKSTLLGLLPRFFDPDMGRVTIGGTDIRRFDLGDLRARIGLVLQPPLVLPLTLAENIGYGCPGASPAAIEQAAERAQLADVAARLPAGYGTPIGEGGLTLSDGERQRVTIARALLKDAPILLMDEPTSALDTRTEAAVMTAVARLMAGRTCIVIAHRLSTVLDADRIVVMDEGRIVEQGTVAALVRRNGPFAALYEAARRPSVEDALNRSGRQEIR